MDAICDPEDRIASDTGLSEQALRQLMREAFLLEMEQKRQLGETMLSGKVARQRDGIRYGSDQGGPGCRQPFVNRVAIGSGHGRDANSRGAGIARTAR